MRRNRVWQHKILNKYISINFIKVFFYVLLTLSGIIFLITFLEKVKSANIPSNILLLNILYELPTYLGTLLPFSILISSMILIYKLENTSELTIIRGSGVSVWQFITPIILISMIIGIIYTTGINPLSVHLKHVNKELEKTYKLSTTDIDLKYTNRGFWLKEQNDQSQSFVYAEEIQKKNNYLSAKYITIFELDKNKNFVQRIEAKEGNIKDNLIEMNNVNILVPAKKIQTFKTYLHPTNLSLQKLTDNFELPDAVSFWKLPQMINFFDKNGFPIRNYQITYYKLIFLPISLIAMAIFGAIFSLSTNTRDVKSPMKIIFGTGMGFIIFFMNQVFMTFGKAGTLPIIISTGSIPILIILLSILSLLTTEDG